MTKKTWTLAAIGVLALAGGADGMDFVRGLLADAPQHLSEHGVLMLDSPVSGGVKGAMAGTMRGASVSGA